MVKLRQGEANSLVRIVNSQVVCQRCSAHECRWCPSHAERLRLPEQGRVTPGTRATCCSTVLFQETSAALEENILKCVKAER